jgi:predicted transcriptional regulator
VSLVLVGNELRNARCQLGISQRALGARVGIPQQRVSQVETGTHSPELSSLLRHARAVGWSNDQFCSTLSSAVDKAMQST